MIRTQAYALTLRLICTWLLMTLAIGTLSSWFLIHLNAVNDYREGQPFLLYLLPIAGVVIGWFYYSLGKELEQGNNLVIQRIVGKEKSTINWLMAPFIYFSTLGAHLFGASVGREGTAIQYSAGITDGLLVRFKIPKHFHKVFLQSAVAAGFASVFGTPLTGFLFALEWTPTSIKWKQLPIIALSAYAAYSIGHLWGAPHTLYPTVSIPSWSWNFIWIIALAGVLFGLTARFFILLTQWIKKHFEKLIAYPPLRPFVGGIIIIGLFLFVQDASYLGLGIPTIQRSFSEIMLFHVFALKLLFTSVSIASGFKGGEVTPLFFIGATLGSALSLYLPIDFMLIAALGFVAVFAGATNTPLACSIMALELFGWDIIWLVLPTCYLAYNVSGQNSIYSAQIPLLRKFTGFAKG